jgi:hypothetical protein
MLFFRYIFAFLLIILISSAYSQEKKNLLSINAHYGFILVHRDNMGHLVKGHTPMLELNYSRKTSGEKDWQSLYNSPEYGLSLIYSDLANPEQLGFSSALFPYINFPLNRKKHMNLHLKVGTGIGYISKVFDYRENHKNIAVSSHLNGVVNLQLSNRIQLHPSLLLHNGIAFTHYSNGAYKMPNLGLNQVTLHSGFIYNFGQNVNFIRREKINPTKKYRFSFIGTTGWKELFGAGGPKYSIYTLRGSGEKFISPKSSVGTGLDFSFNNSMERRLAADSLVLENPFQYLQQGINMAYALNIDELSFYMNFGVYLHNAAKKDGLFYNRIGVKYHIKNNLLFNVSLKSHFGIADHFEWGIGYIIK